MIHRLTFIFVFMGSFFVGFAQTTLLSHSLWQIENLATGEKGTFSLLIMKDESCTLSLTTASNTYQSKDCTVGKSTVTDYDGNLYQLDFKSTNNFGVSLTLTNKNEITQFRSVLDKSNELSIEPSITPAPPATPKVAVVKATPILEVKKEKQEDVKIEEVKEATSSSEKKSKKSKVTEQIEPIKSSSNRQIVYKPDIVNNCKKVYGVVVFDVTISKTGRVIASKINMGESTNPTSCLVSAAIKVLGDMRWTIIDGNYEEDLTVTFNFVKQ